MNPRFAQQTAAARLTFLPLGDEAEFLTFLHSPDLMHPIRGSLMALRAFGDTAERVFSAVDAAITSFRPDVALRHFIWAGAPWACERRGVPCASAVLAPAHWFSAMESSSSPSPALASLQEAAASLRIRAGRALLGRRLRRAARHLSIKPGRDLLAAEWLGGSPMRPSTWRSCGPSV